MAIVAVNDNVLTTMRAQTFFTRRMEKIVISSASTDWPTPNTRSYATIGEKNKLAKKTPSTMPTAYVRREYD